MYILYTFIPIHISPETSKTTFEDFSIYALDLFFLVHTNMVKIVKDNPQLEKLESQLEDFNTEASFILYGIE